MGRPQKHTNHPLYKLRLQLSETSQAITQPELSRLLGIPVATLQSIECGRRGWTQEVQQKITQALWAVWDGDKKHWIFKHSSPPKKFTYALFKKYQRFIREHASIPETDPESLKARVDALFEYVPKDRWMALYWRLQECLEECRQDFDLKNVEHVFELTTDRINFSPARFVTPEGGWTAEPIQRTYKFPPGLETHLREYYKRCAKHYKTLSQRTAPPKLWSDTLRLDALDSPSR